MENYKSGALLVLLVMPLRGLAVSSVIWAVACDWTSIICPSVLGTLCLAHLMSGAAWTCSQYEHHVDSSQASPNRRLFRTRSSHSVYWCAIWSGLPIQASTQMWQRGCTRGRASTFDSNILFKQQKVARGYAIASYALIDCSSQHARRLCCCLDRFVARIGSGLAFARMAYLCCKAGCSEGKFDKDRYVVHRP